MINDSQPTCPFPELAAFCDLGNEFIAQPYRAGAYWVGTDGKILAMRATDEPIPEGKPRVDCRNVIADMDASEQHADWRILPPLTAPELPLVYCTDCNGTGKTPAFEDCDECGGTGECSHCGAECEHCRGKGKMEVTGKHDHCETCGGSGKVTKENRWVIVDGHAIQWAYLAQIAALGAEIAWHASPRSFFMWRTGKLRGIVMPLTIPDDYDKQIMRVDTLAREGATT